MHGLAIHLGWDPSKVSNIEHGKVRATEVDLVQFMATCGKDLHYYEEFRDRYHNAFDLYFAPRMDLRLLYRTHTFRIVPAEVSTFRSSQSRHKLLEYINSL